MQGHGNDATELLCWVARLLSATSPARHCTHVFMHVAGQCVSFAEVQEAVRLTGQTAIGYIRGSGTSAGSERSSRERQRRQAVLGCSASHRVTFEPADRIVVIALVSMASTSFPER